MKKSFVVSVFVDVEIPDKKIEKTIKDYRECINETADINDIMQQIAWNEARYGGFCEGVGENGKDFIAKITRVELRKLPVLIQKMTSNSCLIR